MLGAEGFAEAEDGDEGTDGRAKDVRSDGGGGKGAAGGGDSNDEEDQVKPAKRRSSEADDDEKNSRAAPIEVNVDGPRFEQEIMQIYATKESSDIQSGLGAPAAFFASWAADFLASPRM